MPGLPKPQEMPALQLPEPCSSLSPTSKTAPLPLPPHPSLLLISTKESWSFPPVGSVPRGIDCVSQEFVLWGIIICKMGFPGSSADKEPACNAGDPSSIPGSGRSPIPGRDRLPTPVFLGFPGGSDEKEFTCNAGDLGSIPRFRRSPGEGNSYPLQYSGLKNSMDRVAKNRTRLSDFHFTYVKWYKTPCNCQVKATTTNTIKFHRDLGLWIGIDGECFEEESRLKLDQGRGERTSEAGIVEGSELGMTTKWIRYIEGLWAPDSSGVERWRNNRKFIWKSSVKPDGRGPLMKCKEFGFYHMWKRKEWGVVWGSGQAALKCAT